MIPVPEGNWTDWATKAFPVIDTASVTVSVETAFKPANEIVANLGFEDIVNTEALLMLSAVNDSRLVAPVTIKSDLFLVEEAFGPWPKVKEVKSVAPVNLNDLIPPEVVTEVRFPAPVISTAPNAPAKSRSVKEVAVVIFTSVALNPVTSAATPVET